MQGLLAGLRVLDLAGEPARMAARILADLGAEVVRVEAPGGDPQRGSLRAAAWDAGKETVSLRPGDPRLDELLDQADVLFDTPSTPGAWALDPSQAPTAVWVSVTPFGRTGPRAGWSATDLGVMAASGNMYATGDPDRPPVRCTAPTAYAHGGAEAAFAALTALATGRPQRVDVSLQEVVLVSNMGAVGRFARSPFRGRRSGSSIGRTREIWPCADGFVSFGLRGGKARVPSLQIITRLVEEAGLATPALTERDWVAYNHNTVSDEDLRAIEEPIGRYFSTRTMAELYEIACHTNLMLAPANSPKELHQSKQLEFREFFVSFGDFERFPRSFARLRDRDGEVAQAGPQDPAIGGFHAIGWMESSKRSGPAWSGTNILEFGSGAAGPIATRYFAEHGATVIRVESRSRPDFLRTYALHPDNPHGLEGSDMFDALNAGKLGVTLNLKHPRGAELARRLVVEWAQAVSENFAPRAMPAFGLDYDTLALAKPDLVMVSACLQGQTGPHRDYPGFGGQGAALSGYNFLTGWPDRYPIGPFGTITDSLSPRFVATALAAGLLYRRRTGRGVYVDLSQVEAAAFTLSPWLLDWSENGRVTTRMGNRSPDAVPHGAFPCRGDDRWVAVAVWDDAAWDRMAAMLGVDDRELSTLSGRLERIEEVEAAVAAWTRSRTADEVARVLQTLGVEAVPVADFGDAFADAQLAARDHFVALTHPFLGDGCYERNGFRLSEAPSGYDRPSPTLGQHNELVLGDILGLSATAQKELRADGALD